MPMTMSLSIVLLAIVPWLITSASELNTVGWLRSTAAVFFPFLKQCIHTHNHENTTRHAVTCMNCGNDREKKRVADDV